MGAITDGLLALVGIAADDTEAVMRSMIAKMINLRIFEDAAGKMNLSLQDTGGSLLLVSQFTLYADCRKGRRPSYTNAAPPDAARQMFERLVELARLTGVQVATGQFQATMEVSLVNRGPVTIILDSHELGLH